MADRATLVRGPGTLSGRARSEGWTPPEGEWAYVLGSDVAGYKGKFLTNDSVKVEQFARYDGVDPDNVAVARARIVTRSAAGAGSWVVSTYNDVGTAWLLGAFGFPFPPNVVIDMDDLAIPLITADTGGTSNIGYQLTIVDTNADVESEIPAFYVDAITIAPIPGGIGVFNRYPSRDMVDVPRDTRIAFTLIGTAGVPDVNATTIYVNGVLALLNGVEQNGFVVGDLALGGTQSISFLIEPPTPFESEELVTIRVLTSLGVTTVDTSWSFTAVDETAPRILTASASSHKTIRVLWDEDMTMLDPEASNDALNPANWTVSPTGVLTLEPAVTVEVVSVAVISSREVELTLDIPMTQRVSYEVVAANVEDLHGNAVVAPYDRYTIAGFTCAGIETRRFEMWQMLSDMDRRRDTTHDMQTFLSVLQELLDQVLCDVDRWTEIFDVDMAEERYLDQLLITLGNPFTFDLEAADKRRLIKLLVRMYQQKGTAVGIINVVRFFLGLEITILPYNSVGWLLGVDELGIGTILASSASFARYSFVIDSPIILTDEQRARVRELAIYMKPAHTHLIDIVEPEVVVSIDHVELGLSELGNDQWMLH